MLGVKCIHFDIYFLNSYYVEFLPVKGTIYIDNEEIGFADFRIIDASMGVIQGMMTPTELYTKYRKRVQDLYNKKGTANKEDFNFKIFLENKTVVEPAGGIGITDAPEFNELIVEAAGVDVECWEK